MTERTPPILPIPATQANPPATETPETADSACASPKPPRHDDPTRYGDWELSGKCVDF